ncbi:hypothetical protein [Rudaeicoccus suwonensis]|uniref:Uncharacterized protein n=1 Tax=Rudaeicoccus suwonensis TaxID=657409 RepID=A0A561EAI5_9MICO|nr:hypothetical protein [Rudaeicoccus suwonensis]TWE12622.1 hypothetical protein BKA23_1437 [Rudaeicoccus suwonensis]
MVHDENEPKAVPSSDLNARQEVLTWAVIDVAALLVMLLIAFIFRPEHGWIPGPVWLTGPLVGWVVGNVVGWFLPRMASVPSLAIAGAALVLVVLCAIVLRGSAFAFGQALAGCFIGLAGGVLVGRSWKVHHEAHIAH